MVPRIASSSKAVQNSSQACRKVLTPSQCDARMRFHTKIRLRAEAWNTERYFFFRFVRALLCGATRLSSAPRETADDCDARFQVPTTNSSVTDIRRIQHPRRNILSKWFSRISGNVKKALELVSSRSLNCPIFSPIGSWFSRPFIDASPFMAKVGESNRCYFAYFCVHCNALPLYRLERKALSRKISDRL